MSLFEVFIPAKPGSDNKSVYLQVEASSWLLALRSGLRQVGEQGDQFKQVMVQNREDGTVVVKDPTARRVFRIKELGAAKETSAQVEDARIEQENLRREAEQAAQTRLDAEKRLKETIAKEKAAEKRGGAEAAKAAGERREAERQFGELQVRERDLAKRAAENAEGRSLEVDVKYVDDKTDLEVEDKAEESEGRVDWNIDDVLSDMFMEAEELENKDFQQAQEFVLGLADGVIKSEASSVILTDSASLLADMYFSAARGPVSSEIKKIRIPRGKGIVGFSVQIGMPLTVSNVQKNPNFFGIADAKTGFKTKSLLCVPIPYGERILGAIELINKIGANKWAPEEVNVMVFLAKKLGERIGRVRDDEIRIDID